MKNIVNYIIGSFTFLIYFMGGLDSALKSLLIIIALDYLTGVASAFYNKKLNSKIGLKGLLKKFGYLCVIALSFIIDNLTGQNGLIRLLIIYYFIANDSLSIVENLAKMNIKLPQKFLDSLEQIKNKGE